MPQNRYFCSDLVQHVTLKNDEFHYLKNVMRSRVGDSVELINGKGMLAKAEVSKLFDKEAHLTVLELVETEKPLQNVTLALAILKPSHLEFALEKCCELGIDRFILFPAGRSEKKELSELYQKRLQTIILSSTKQCGRLFLPSLEIKKDLKSSLSGRILFGDLAATTPLQRAKQDPITLVIGPESGFTEQERQDLLACGAQGVRLHANTLRAETAAIVGAALLCQL